MPLINEPRHEISNNVVCAASKLSDQPALTRSLVKAFASMDVKPLTVRYLEFVILIGCCTGPPESTLVKMSHCWKSHVAAQMSVNKKNRTFRTTLVLHGRVQT